MAQQPQVRHTGISRMMTTLDTHTNEVGSLTAKAAELRTGTGSSSVGTQRRLLPILGAIFVVGLIGYLAFGYANIGGFGHNAGTTDDCLVMPRSFAVVLKEKGELKAAHSTDIACEVEDIVGLSDQLRGAIQPPEGPAYLADCGTTDARFRSAEGERQSEVEWRGAFCTARARGPVRISRTRYLC